MIESYQRLGLIVYSPKENKTIFTYRFPREFTSSGPNSVSEFVIDDHHGCDNAMVIVSDSLAYRLYVFDYRRQRSWIVEQEFLKYVPENSHFQYENITFFVPTGVFTVMLTPPLGKARTRYLLFGSYTGISIYSVPLSILYREELWTRGVSLWRPFRKLDIENKKQKESKFFDKLKGLFKHDEESEAEDFTFIDVNKYFIEVARSEALFGTDCDVVMEQAVLYCVLPRERGIGVWEINKPFKEMRIIARNDQLFENIAFIRVVKNLQGETEIIVTTSPLVVSKNYFLNYLITLIDFFFKQIFAGQHHPDPSNYAVYVCKARKIYKEDNVRCTSNIFSNCR